MTEQQKKILSYSIKAIIIVLAAVFIYQKLVDNKNLKNFLDIITKLDKWAVWNIIGVVFLLMLVNWFIESLKWQYLIRNVEKISLFKAIESVFCGLTWAVFTPNRIGEFGGRVFFLSPRKRILGVVAMGVGQISQMVITNVLGSLALLWFVDRFLSLDFWLFIALTFLVVIFCFFFLLFYFNIHWLEGLMNNIKFLKKYNKFFSVLSQYHQKELLRIILLGLSRFSIFTSQYLIIIHFLIPDVSLIDTVLIVFIFFFIQSFIPSLDLLDVGVRSLTATYFFGFITHQDIAIMSSIALIWLVNLIIPAILGSFFVFKLKFFDHRN